MYRLSSDHRDANAQPEPKLKLSLPDWLILVGKTSHSTVSGAAAAVLADYYGEESSLTFDSDVMLGVTRSFTSFSSALEEIKDARIFAGIHFLSACDDGQVTGQQVAHYILGNSLRSLNGERNGQLTH